MKGLFVWHASNCKLKEMIHNEPLATVIDVLLLCSPVGQISVVARYVTCNSKDVPVM